MHTGAVLNKEASLELTCAGASKQAVSRQHGLANMSRQVNMPCPTLPSHAYYDAVWQLAEVLTPVSNQFPIG